MVTASRLKLSIDTVDCRLFTIYSSQLRCSTTEQQFAINFLRRPMFVASNARYFSAPNKQINKPTNVNCFLVGTLVSFIKINAMRFVVVVVVSDPNVCLQSVTGKKNRFFSSYETHSRCRSHYNRCNTHVALIGYRYLHTLLELNSTPQLHTIFFPLNVFFSHSVSHSLYTHVQLNYTHTQFRWQ